MKLQLLSLTLVLIAGGCASVVAEDSSSTTSETPDNEKVIVDGFGIQPMGNISSPDGAMVLHPKALLGFGDDSNVYATTTNKKSSAFWDLVAGLDSKWVPNSEDKLVLSAEFEGQRYLQQSDRNLAGGTGIFSYRHTANLWNAGGTLSASRTDDPFVVTGQEVKHDNLDFSADVTRKMQYNSATLGVNFDRLRYLEDAPGVFGKDDRNGDLYGVNGRVGHVVGDDSEFYVRVMYAHHEYDQSTFSMPINIPGTGFFTTHGYNDSNSITGLLGWQQKIGTRSGLLLELGADDLTYKDNFEGDSNFDDKHVVNLAANASYRWNFEEGSWLGLKAYSTTEDSVFANSAWVYGLGADARLRIKSDDKAALFGSLTGYDQKDDGGPKTTFEPDPEIRSTIELAGGAEYILEQGLGLRLKDTFDRSNSKYFNSFSRNVIELEAAIVY